LRNTQIFMFGRAARLAQVEFGAVPQFVTPPLRDRFGRNSRQPRIDACTRLRTDIETLKWIVLPRPVRAGPAFSFAGPLTCVILTKGFKPILGGEGCFISLNRLDQSNYESKAG
jgi:hypothetical protein